MKIPKAMSNRIARLSALILDDFEWLRKHGSSGKYTAQQVEKIQLQMYNNEQKLEQLTNKFTPDELSEQITDENFRALNCAGDFGNKYLEG